MVTRRRYQAVVFDLYGTLIDTPAGQKSARIEMASLLGVQPEEFEAAWARFLSHRDTGRLTTAEAIEAAMCFMGLALDDPGRVEAAVIVRYQSVREALQPRPGAIELLTTLRTKGYALGLVSNCSSEVPELWNETAFRGLFDATVFSASEGLGKPDKTLFVRAAERLGLTPDRCLYVGDGGDDELDAAAGTGMTPWLLLLPDEDPPAHDAHAASADRWRHRHLQALNDVLGLLEASSSRCLKPFDVSKRKP